MKNITPIILFFFVCSCTQNAPHNKIKKTSDVDFSFNLKSPDKKFELPDALHEISGVAVVNDSIVACIADEKGMIYFYNLNNSSIDNKLKFADKGDFEDLTIIGDTIYALDSKGVIWSIKNYNNDAQIELHILAIEEPFELEGLCQRKDSLFIAAKYYHNKKRDEKGTLPVWKLSQEIQIEEPLFSLPDFVEPPGKSSVPFHTSAFIFDEVNGQWYCLSTHTKALIQCDYTGRIIAVRALSEKIFSQPEGICFTKSGDLLISNEGKDGAASILLFTNKNNKR
jgi:hypothetical protein